MNNQGFKWGIFTARLPLLHMRIEWPDLFQGLVVSLSTGLALVPLLIASFGLSFEEAIAISMLHTMLATSHVIIFGEPFASGWITPALPLVLAVVISDYEEPTERFQMMTALSLDFAILTFFLAVTGIGRKLTSLVPAALKAGIIFGAALSAFKRIFYDDVQNFTAMPLSFILSIITCLIILYLPAFQKLKSTSKIASAVSSIGLLPAFIVAGLVGVMSGELTFDIKMGFLIPPVADLMEKVSPFSIGFPPVEYFLVGLPLAFITYLILFGDLITGATMIENNQHHRPDDPIDVDLNRSHYAVSIRNFVMALCAPFFPTQGVLWAGAQVLMIERWKQGREKMESLFSGISAFYYYGIPAVFFVLPVLTTLRPFMPIALMLTLLLTGIACSRLALNLATQNIDKAIMLIVAVLLAFYAPWLGLSVGVIACLLRAAIKARI